MQWLWLRRLRLYWLQLLLLLLLVLLLLPMHPLAGLPEGKDAAAPIDVTSTTRRVIAIAQATMTTGHSKDSFLIQAFSKSTR